MPTRQLVSLPVIQHLFLYRTRDIVCDRLSLCHLANHFPCVGDGKSNLAGDVSDFFFAIPVRKMGWRAIDDTCNSDVAGVLFDGEFFLVFFGVYRVMYCGVVFCGGSAIMRGVDCFDGGSKFIVLVSCELVFQ